MLRELRIQNFAIIDRLEVKFHAQLNVLTGETGSGKSIVVDAVDLLLGGRASSEQIRTGCEESVLEAAFEIPPNSRIASQLKEMDLPAEAQGDVIIRRVIARTGKGRAYINGSLVTMGQLQSLGNLLVDIHGQHEHQTLLKSDHQLYLLDAYGKLLDLSDEYRLLYAALRKAEDELAALEGLERDRFQREDLLKFQAQEIGTASPVTGEDIRLEQERNVLANSERLSVLANEAYQNLYAADNAVLSQLAQIKSSIDELARMDERMKDLVESCSGAATQLREVAERLRDYKDGIEHDPDRLGHVEDRLHLLASLKKKYAPTIEGVLEKYQKIQEELTALSTRDERIKFLQDRLGEERKQCIDLGKRLTKERAHAARLLEKQVEKELGHLNMGKTRFKIHMESRHEIDHLGPSGSDSVEFLVAPNPGEEPKPLARIASGGELSRIMLSLKSILAGVDQVPTLIFDEVDAGIGGGVAEIVGQRLRGLAGHRQVLCITHLPQIASQAAAHFTVEKSSSNDRTVTRVRQLEKEERVEEIARMLGGHEITPTAFKHAREMLNLRAP